MISSYYYFWEYWNLYHKVTFDGHRKLILINHGETNIDWREDVYESWKEWILLTSHIDNPGYAQAMRVVGGDPISADGTNSLGITFFLMNGWRIQTWSGNHRLVIIGNVYTEEGDPIYIPHEGAYNTIIELRVSNLTELIRIASDGEMVATAVRDELAQELSRIDVAISSRASQTSVDTISTNIASLSTAVAELKTLLNASIAEQDVIKSSVDTMVVDLESMFILLDIVRKHATNRTRIDPIDKTLTVFDDDGVSALGVFQLTDRTGTPSIDEVFERNPQ